MDYKALVDFNKYTLALAAAGFVYALEKLAPMESAAGRYLLLAVLGIFFLSIAFGVLVFAVATRAQHDTQNVSDRAKSLIRFFGLWHAILFGVGISVVAVILADRVLSPPAPDTQVVCCCDSS